MANEYDLWNDIEHYDRLGDRKIKTPNGIVQASDIASDLLKCWNLRYNKYNKLKQAEKSKDVFEKKYG